MPWKSKAQARYMHMLANQGKVNLDVHEWDEATKRHGGFQSLPEHVSDLKKDKKKKSASMDNLDLIVRGIMDAINQRRK